MQTAWLVAGGVGLPPVLWLAESLAEQRVATTDFFGARSADLIPLEIDKNTTVSRKTNKPTMCVNEFARYGIPTVICTDDGSLGYHGNVLQAVDDTWRAGPDHYPDLVVYACGPEPMLEAVSAWANTQNVLCYLCMERAMACGVGTCQSCVVPVRSDQPDGWVYELCCTDGPVFDARDVLWSIGQSSATD
jgi:dihydroorotate dehydrogenase electron transfer subunit